MSRMETQSRSVQWWWWWWWLDQEGPGRRPTSKKGGRGKSDTAAKWTREKRTVKSFYLLSPQPPVPLYSMLSLGQVQKKKKRQVKEK